MEESFDAALLDGATSGAGGSASAGGDPNHGWQKVRYGKRQRRSQPHQAAADPDRQRPNGNVFASVEQKAHERRRGIESAAAAEAAAEAAPARSRRVPADSDSDDEDDGSGTEETKARENGNEATKKVKTKKPKKLKITVAEAAAKIDAADLTAFLVDVTASYESQQDIQLMRFADYFGRAFTPVSASQFPWANMFKESPLAKIADVPLINVSEAVYKTSADWLAQKSLDSLDNFVLWCLDGILTDLASQQATAKNKKAIQQTSSKSQVAIFVVLAMTLRRKPDTLIRILPKLKDNSRYQGQDKLPILVWVIAQVSHADVVIGMYLWAHYLFPIVCAKQGGNPRSRDLVLQLVERILSGPKARPILLNGAVRKGERLIPPATFDLLMRMTFPSSASRIKATERFEAVYPILKEIALAGSAGTKTTKQASQQLLPISIRVIHENIPELTKEATDVFVWCLIQNAECYKQWEKIHMENIEASTAVLKKLQDHWNEYSTRISSETLTETLKHLKAENEEALRSDLDADKQASFKEADKYCKAVLGKLMRGSNCMKTSFSVFLLLMVAFVAVFLSMESSEWDKLKGTLKNYLPLVSLE